MSSTNYVRSQLSIAIHIKYPNDNGDLGFIPKHVIVFVGLEPFTQSNSLSTNAIFEFR